MRILFFTFVSAIPQLTYIGGLMLLIFIIFAVLGVQIFALVQKQGAIDEHANFRSFGSALITLFRMSTGESWHELMYDCARTKSIIYNCKDVVGWEDIKTGKIDGCGNSFAYIYSMLFMIVVSFVFLNLFIAIIITQYEESQNSENLPVGESTIEFFK
jgi:voltage-dependent calcium channel L type alpha-1D